jgi:hypothetical protein
MSENETANETTALHEAIIAVMESIGTIEKTQENTFDKYKFRGIDDIYNVLQPALVAHGLVIIPQLVSWERSHYQSSNDRSMQLCTVDVNYLISHNGASLTARVVGEGADRGDKAMNKAMTSAFKNFFFQVFVPPTILQGTDSEFDSPELGDPGQERNPTSTTSDFGGLEF